MVCGLGGGRTLTSNASASSAAVPWCLSLSGFGRATPSFQGRAESSLPAGCPGFVQNHGASTPAPALLAGSWATRVNNQTRARFGPGLSHPRVLGPLLLEALRKDTAEIKTPEFGRRRKVPCSCSGLGPAGPASTPLFQRPPAPKPAYRPPTGPM